ncbi:hypothetical protein SARC_03855, partial [Sphaeroforma arctica JP610]
VKDPSIVVFSGGTAFNGVCREMSRLSNNVAYIMPVSDDGGSTKEIIRVLGGPAIGDVRSRCLRLSDTSTYESRAVQRILGHRLTSESKALARAEFYTVLEGEHVEWAGISDSYKQIIKSYLVNFHQNILKNGFDNEPFDYRNGAIGNFFFTGSRIFFRSMEAAIFLYSRVSGIHVNTAVIPCIRTNSRVVLGAECMDGSVIRGQSMISHPPYKANSQLVDKDDHRPLESPIRRVYYMTNDGSGHSQLHLQANPAATKRINKCQALVYGMGSFYTSILPNLVLCGMGSAISASDAPKVFLVNGCLDRETFGMTVADMITSIANALNGNLGNGEDPEGLENEGSVHRKILSHPVKSYVTHVLIPEKSTVPVEVEQLKNNFGVKVLYIPSQMGKPYFDGPSLMQALNSLIERPNIEEFVTSVLHKTYL